MKTRLPRMSFDGHPYPPIPPDASTFPRPTDDWFTQPIQNAQAPRGKPGPVRMPTSHLQATPSQFSDSYQPHAYGTFQRPLLPTEFAHTTHPPHHEQVFAWSPSYADPAAQPAGYRAPMLHPRHIHLPQRPITPHDTYRYPVSHGEHIYVAPAIAVEGPTKETINSAFAYWYVDQVIGLLVKPGQYRPGVGGASSEIWGLGGRETDGWIRMGRPPPDYSKSWGRMGMTATPLPVPRRLRFRTPETEPRDPWNVLWNNHPKRSSSLVTFVLDMLQRMTISPTAVVAGVWFLTGLGLHEGDGQKGAELREMLSEQKWSDLEAVEKRVATLGLLLAGKWLDDNSFLTKSW